MASETDAEMFSYRDNEDGTVAVTGFSEKGEEAQLTVISIPKMVDGKQVTSIDYCAFYGCRGLESITLPEGVTSIGQYAFYGCSGLESITLPEGVTRISGDAFYGCSGLTSFEVAAGNATYASKDGVLYSKDGTVLYDFVVTAGRKEFIVPEGVTTIGDSAFYNCRGLESITLPEGVTSIGDYTFDGCSGLESITLPEGVTTIGYRAFSGCSRLTLIAPSGSYGERYAIENGIPVTNP